MADHTKFLNMMSQFHITLNEEQLEQFDKYYTLIVEWNKVMNLTGITEYEEVFCKHFADSLAITKAVDMKNITSVIDVGTGAGFPGVPIKIAFPHVKVVLLDSLSKRVKFLNAVIEELGLKNIEAIHGRAEDFAREEQYREQYDMVVSRAVANLATLSEYCVPYCKMDGYFVPYKSGDIEEELNESKKAIHILGGKVENVIQFDLPDTDISRSLVKIYKEKKTGLKYPRKSGIPSRKPLH